MAITMLALAATLLVACSAPERSTVTEGPYRLELVLQRSVWSASEAIEGEGILSVTDGQARDLGGSGSGLVLFGFEEVGGSRRIQPAMSDDCAGYRLSPDTPLSRELTKSGGWVADDPDAEFYKAFFADPLIHLPPGQWRVGAIASFSDGRSCGDPILMETWVDLRVVP